MGNRHPLLQSKICSHLGSGEWGAAVTGPRGELIVEGATREVTVSLQITSGWVGLGLMSWKVPRGIQGPGFQTGRVGNGPREAGVACAKSLQLQGAWPVGGTVRSSMWLEQSWG